MTTILVIEDNERNMRLVNDILVRAGYQVIQAMTGTEGLTAVLKRHPALIVMDIQLLDMDGKDIIRQLKSSPITKDIKIIALTAQAMSHDKKEIEESGCDAYISKPYSYKTLLVNIEKLLTS